MWKVDIMIEDPDNVGFMSIDVMTLEDGINIMRVLDEASMLHFRFNLEETSPGPEVIGFAEPVAMPDEMGGQHE